MEFTLATFPEISVDDRVHMSCDAFHFLKSPLSIELLFSLGSSLEGFSADHVHYYDHLLEELRASSPLCLFHSFFLVWILTCFKNGLCFIFDFLRNQSSFTLLNHGMETLLFFLDQSEKTLHHSVSLQVGALPQVCSRMSSNVSDVCAMCDKG